MNIKYLSLALFLFSTILNANEVNADICSDSVANVCNIQDQVARNNYRNTVLTEIRNKAHKNAVPKIAEMKKKIPAIRIIKRTLEEMRIINKEITLESRIKFPQYDSLLTTEKVEYIKNIFYKITSESNFQLTTKELIKEKIKNARVLAYEEFIKDYDLEGKSIASFFIKPCGDDGMDQNAFALSKKDLGNSDIVVICPGLIIDSMFEKDENKRFHKILHTISHELAHHLDINDLGAESYSKYLVCIASNYSVKLRPSNADRKFCERKSTTAVQCASRLTMSHGNELIADVWASKVLAEYAKDNNLSLHEATDLIKISISVLCGSKDNGTHPAGELRIGELLMTQPHIENILSCQNSNFMKSKTCTFF